MANHYTNILIVYPDLGRAPDGYDLQAELIRRKWGDGPLERAVPMPPELESTSAPSHPTDPGLAERIARFGAGNWFDWQVKHRGVKWDAYDVLEPIGLPGDCWAVQLTFCTAWGAPNERTRRAMARELLDTYHAARVVWLGLQPFDDTFGVIGEWTHPMPPEVPCDCDR